MPAKLTPTEVEAIRRLHGEGRSLRSIATELGRSFSVVGRYCRDMGLTFNAERTANATEKKQAENKAKRAELECRLLDEATELLDQLHEPHLVYNFGGRDNTYEEHTLTEPDVTAKKNLVQAAGTAIDKALKLADADKATTGADAGRSMVGALFAALAATPVQDAPEQSETPDH